MNKTNGMKINLIYLTTLNYRKSLFKELGNISDFTLVCGDKSPYKNIVFDDDCDGYKVCKLKNVFLLKGRHRLTFQLPNFKVLKLIFKTRNQHFVFLGVDPHIVSSLFYSFFLKLLGYKISWWGHGALGGGVIKAVRMVVFKYSHRILVYGNDAEVLSNSKLKHKVRVIGNSMNWEDYADTLSNKSTGVSPKRNGLNMVFSGRIVSDKKIEVLLEACLKLQVNYKLIIIGEGDELEPSKAYCEKHSLNVEFIGAQYGVKVKEVMEWADVMVITGKVGLSLVHAYGNNLPVIMHDRFELHSPEYEVHTNSDNFLFTMDNSDDLVIKLTNIFKKDLIPDEVSLCQNSLRKYGYFPDVVSAKFVNSLK